MVNNKLIGKIDIVTEQKSTLKDMAVLITLEVTLESIL